ncbi:Fe-only nitrogenase accessory AnfO family protein [Desulfovibrio legallii]|uniref:Iron only nitrogenase protein AnfO (AnfO_nitrog) n=1 Tax=Desulfovibrio legallii TaxID=571438 RepID=A0A1G7PI35_9BACT|nr:Fe-only nitrogenase accessory AnfO family protein [Desulfovibrio legallii]SDF86042.1 Iron only nitrogenase protein AnfO (AnfO_nitrog) [Desulfovibrio legallii]
MRCSHIAVMQTADAALAGVETCARIVLWTRAEDAETGWAQGPALPFSLGGCGNMAALRGRLRQLAGLLPQGAALVGTGISGLAYNELSRLGFCLCELTAFDPQLLPPLAAEIEAKAQEDAPVPTGPVATDAPGVYAINLMEVMAAHPEISSKKALRPFLASTPFVELELICGHMPPWLEEYMREHRLTCTRSHLPDGALRARITHALCGEAAQPC